MLIELIKVCRGCLISLFLFADVSVMVIISIEGSDRVVHWRANASLLLSYPTIYNITKHINHSQHTN